MIKLIEIGRVWDPDKRKYIRVVIGGVPPRWHGCYDPTNNRIHLNSRKSYRSDDTYMDCCLHEALHACFPDISEETIGKRTPILKRLLKKMGVQPCP